MVSVAKRKDIDAVFGTRLRALRQAAGLTQAELAEQVGTDAGTVARLERSEREPVWSTVLKLADALGVSVEEFRETEGDD